MRQAGLLGQASGRSPDARWLHNEQQLLWSDELPKLATPSARVAPPFIDVGGRGSPADAGEHAPLVPSSRMASVSGSSFEVAPAPA